MHTAYPGKRHMNIKNINTINFDNLTNAPCQQDDRTIEKRRQESNEIYQRGLEIAKLYEFHSATSVNNITQAVLQNKTTPAFLKQAIQHKQRQIYLFEYPSGPFQVKGFLSLARDYEHQPLLVYLRGGNKIFGLPNPAILSDFGEYTILATTYRDGVSEGTDEFGGDDVLDVGNLIAFLPKLQEMMGIHLPKTPIYMLGESRGAMQMLLALNRSPWLQSQITAAIAMTGLLNMASTIDDRDDMKAMFIKNFDMPSDPQQQIQWISRRNPVENLGQISPTLPLLITQGGQDTRVCLSEGYHLISALKKRHFQNVWYWEEPQAEHCFRNIERLQSYLADWFSQYS